MFYKGKKESGRLEVALEHPEGFLVPLDPADDEVLGFEIVGGFGGIAGGVGVGEGFFVGDNQGGNEIARGQGTGGQFLDAGLAGQRTQSAEGIGVECAEAFGDLIDGMKEVFVLALEGLVQREKIGAFDVPMGVMREAHERVGIGEQLVERGRDGGVGLGFCGGKMGKCFHRGEWCRTKRIFATSREEKATLGNPGFSGRFPVRSSPGTAAGG